MSESDRMVAAYFDRLAVERAETYAKADWGRPDSQRLRFLALLGVGVGEGSSVLDVGCGAGDFCALLRELGLDVRYTGIDLSSEMVRIASERFPGVRFQNCTVAELAGERFDYVVGSGIHYYRTPDCEARARATLAAMFSACRLGVATNFLSVWWSGTYAAHVWACDPLVMLAYARTLTPRIVLRHDYLWNDFTLYLYPDESRLQE